METSLYDVRNKLLNKAILYGALFLLPALVSSVVRYVDTGWQKIYYYHISVDILILLLALFREKISLEIKAHCYAILFVSLGIAGALTFGLGNAVVYPILAVTVITLILDKKQGIYYSVVIVLLMCLIGTLFLLKLRTVRLDITELNSLPAFWINTIVAGIYVFLVIVNTIGEFNKYFNKTINNLNNKINELNSTKTDLISTSEELKAAKEQAEQREHQIRQISNNFETCVIYQLQISGEHKRKFIYVSQSIIKYCGYNADEVIANSNLVYDRLYPEDAVMLQILENESINNFSVVKSELRIKKPDGTTVWVYNVMQPREKDGTIIWDGFGVDITDLKKTHSELEIFKRFLDFAPISAFWINKEGRFTYVNDTACKSLGYTHEEILNLSIYDVGSNVTQQEWTEYWKQIAVNENISSETNNKRKDGSIFPVEIYLSKFIYGNNEYLTGFSKDITYKKKIKEDLIKSENLYRSLFNNMTSGLILFELIMDENNKPYDARAIQANPEYEKLTGLNWFNDAGESIKKGTIKIPDVYLEKYLEVGLTGVPFQYERYNEDINKFLEVRIFSPTKGLIALLINDISDRRNNEIRIEKMIHELKKNNLLLRESEEKFNKAFNNSSIPMAISSLHDSRFIEVNKELCTLFEWTKEELIGYTARDLKMWRSYEVRNSIIEDLKNNKPTQNIEIVMVTKTGKTLFILMSFDKIIINNNDYLLTSVIDITKLKNTEEALKKNEQHLQELLNSVTNYSYSLGIKNGVVNELKVSEGCETITGYSKSEFECNINQWFDIIYPEDKKLIFEHLESNLQKHISTPFEFRIVNKNDKIVWVRNTPVLKFGENSELIRIDGLVADITEKKLLEQQMVTRIIETEENERKKFSQELHDGLGPLLSASKIYIYNITNRKKGENMELYLNKLDSINDEAIKSIKEISNNVSPHIVKNFGLIIALENFIKKINPTINIDFIYNCIKDTRFSDVIEITIYRATTELINNTLKHAKAGNIKISLEEKIDHLQVNYSDDGFGFDYEEIIKSNKGMGLFNIQSRIRSFGGVMQYNSKPNKGVEVYIDLPIQPSVITTQ